MIATHDAAFDNSKVQDFSHNKRSPHSEYISQCLSFLLLIDKNEIVYNC